MFETRNFREIPKKFVTEVYVNPGLKRELSKLEVNPEDLVVFLHPDGELEMRVIDFHHRSADVPLSSPIVHSKKATSHVYCQFDLKGVGFIKPETHSSKKDGIEKGELSGYPAAYIIPNSQETPWGYDALGLFDERMAMTTVKKSEELASLGMRVEAFAALYRLDAIYLERGRLTSVAALKKEASERFMAEYTELKAVLENKDGSRALSEDEKVVIKGKMDDLKAWKNDLMKDFSPVVGVRLMKSVFRIRDLQDATPDQARLMLEEAIVNLQAEQRLLDKGGNESDGMSVTSYEGREVYVKKLSRWFGEGLGILMKTGQSHLFLHMGNLSLAGEVVDLDSVSKVLRTRSGKAYWADGANVYTTLNPEYQLPNCLVKDMRDIAISIKKLIQAMSSHGYGIRRDSRGDIVKAVLEGFTNGLGAQVEPYEAIHVTNERLREAFGQILDRVLIEGRKFEAIPKDGQESGDE
jgi:hypothetical protein